MTERQVRSADQPSVAQGPRVAVLAGLRALKNGGFDDPSRALELSPTVAGSLVAVLAAMRWGAVMIGLAWAAQRLAFSGDLGVVATLTTTIFLASWRTVRPLKLGDGSAGQQTFALADVAILSAAVGVDSGLASPFVGCVLVAVAIVAFGWGLRLGLWAALTALVISSVVPILSASLAAGDLAMPSPLGVMALGAAAVFPGVAQFRLLHMEDGSQDLTSRMEGLMETNHLLGALNKVARTFPSSLDLEDILQATRAELRDSFDAERLALLSYEDNLWAVQIQDAFNLYPVLTSAQLPNPLVDAAAAAELLRIDDLTRYGREGSGMYVRLMIDGRDTGLVAVENSQPGYYNDADAELLAGMADMLALSMANARSFLHLRSLAAAEERIRIARDLHDRLGQWLTYIGLELERINASQPEPSLELKQLHGDTQGAIAELRDTLVELRAAVGPGRPLSVVLSEVVDRFSKRSDVEVQLSVPFDRDLHLAPIVENELLRIAQEALTNVEKHAKATHATVSWSVENGRGVLIVEDNGRGFDPSKGIRGNAYGLVGMRERAASVGAILELTTVPDQGTTVTVHTSPHA